VTDRCDILRQVMSETGTTQVMLARTSGVHQPSISHFLSGKVEFSDEQLDRLLTCMGRRLLVKREPVVPDLTHSEWRSWMLHRRLSAKLTKGRLNQWLPTIVNNLERLRSGVRGRTHLANVDKWNGMIRSQDLAGMRRAMNGLDRASIELREVTPFSGLLPEAERLEVLQELKRSR